MILGGTSRELRLRGVGRGFWNGGLDGGDSHREDLEGVGVFWNS